MNQFNENRSVGGSIKKHQGGALSDKLITAIASPIFPQLDTLLRAGRHIGFDDLDNHAFLMDFYSELEQFYLRYNVELIRAPEGFFYLRPRSTTLIPKSVLTEFDMIVGKVLCYLYLSPERLAHEGIFTLEALCLELLTLAGERRLFKLINQRSSGSDLDRQKLRDKVLSSINKLRRLGMLFFIGNTNNFSITESIFRFGADVRVGDDMREAQLNLIRNGEAVQMEKRVLTDEEGKIVMSETSEELEA